MRAVLIAECCLAGAGLGADALEKLWILADVDEDGMLTLPEFRAAMHLATMAVQGTPVPSAMPPLLARSAGIARGAGGDGVPISEAELQQYRTLFEANISPGDLAMSGNAAHKVRWGGTRWRGWRVAARR